MPVTLTNLPLPWTAEPSLIDYGVDQAPPLGGVMQRGIRVGSRWAVKFSSLPDLAWTDAQKFLAARFAAEVAGSTVVCPWPQPNPGLTLGSPVVAGAGQGGGNLACRGLTPGILAPAGVWFSVVVAGRGYLYQTLDDQHADGAGNITLDIAPWLRAGPADGAALNFAAPNVEGFIDGNGVDWSLAMLSWVGLPAFSITEVA